MWDLVPCPEIEPRAPALGALNLSYWTTREVLLTQIEGTVFHGNLINPGRCPAQCL